MERPNGVKYRGGKNTAIKYNFAQIELRPMIKRVSPGVSVGEGDEYYPFVQDCWSHAQAGSPEIDITCVRCSRVIHNLFNSS